MSQKSQYNPNVEIKHSVQPFFPRSCLVPVITEEGEDGRLEVATGAGVGEEGADEGEDREEKEMESAKDTAEGEGSTSGSTTRS